MVILSNRLETIANRVPAGARLADIGSDHALLPTYLAQRGMISFAVAGEVNPGPFEAASRQVRASGLTKVIDVRRGDGLAVIAPGEVDAIAIAGMGGALIASILEEGKAKLDGVGTLILQPNVGEDAVRRWLDGNGWMLTGEAILQEDGKIYEVLTAVPAANVSAEAFKRLYTSRTLRDGVTLDREALLRFGPYLLEEASPVWTMKWESELVKMERIRQSLLMSELAASKEKARQYAEEMEQIREVLACSQKERP